MIDSEVERLRLLRGTALRVREVARSLRGGHGRGSAQSTLHDSLLDRAGCAAWRVARTVSGRLRAHPYERFQKDAGTGVVVRNSIVAALAALGTKTPRQALVNLEGRLRQLARELDRARALTWAADLSDSFGRSQIEIRSLLAELEYEARTQVTRTHAAIAPSMTPVGANAAEYAATADTDWPYLAL